MTLSLVVLLMIAAGAGIAVAAGRSRKTRRVLRLLLAAYLLMCAALAAAELAVRAVYADPAFPLSAAGINWSACCVSLNAQGFRDRDWTADDLAGKIVVAVAGDEIAMGWGISNPAERFSDVLAGALGDGYAVVNLGILGSGTREQAEALRALPVSVDIVVWAYALGDIASASERRGGGWPLAPVEIPPLARESHLASALFWSAQPSRFPQADPAYWMWVAGQYDDPAVMADHAAQVEAFLDLAAARGARVIAAIFPNPLDAVGSIAATDRVAEIIEARGGQVWRLFDVAAAHESGALLIGAKLPLPDAAFHRLVGEGLAARILGDLQR